MKIEIKGKVHEIEFQDFNLVDFVLDQESKSGRIVLKYDDTDPASINVMFDINSWVAIQSENAEAKGCFGDRILDTIADPNQILKRQMKELLSIADEHGNLVIWMQAVSGVVKIVLQDAKWEEIVNVE